MLRSTHFFIWFFGDILLIPGENIQDIISYGQNCEVIMSYQLIVRTPDMAWLWEVTAKTKAECIAQFKARYPTKWKGLCAHLHNENNLLDVEYKRPGKVRFVRD